MYYDNTDDLLDIEGEERFKRMQHRRLMNLPVGHPDEPEDETQGETEDD